MKYSVLASFLLGFLFIVNALWQSSARDILGEKGNGNELEVTRINSMFAQKERYDESGAPHQVRKLGLGGKKLSARKEPKMVSSVDEKVADGGGTSKISARDDKDASRKSMESLREGTNDQKKGMAMLELTNFQVPRNSPSNTNSNPQNPNAVQVKARFSNSITRPERQITEEHKGTSTTSKKDEETQNLFETAEEIVSLIHKDYKGMARRKPPINNHEPRN